MKLSYKLSLTLLSITLLTGCGGKNFTMQSYADKWFNDKPTGKTTTKDKTVETKEAVTETKKVEDTKIVKEKAPESKQVAQKQEVKKVAKKEPLNNPGKSKIGSTIAPSSVNQRDEHMGGQGAMQTSLNTWTEEEWNPAFEGDEEQTKLDEEATEHFTIQHYIDKYEKYSDTKDEEFKKSGKTKPEANYEKMNKMPVIGK